MTRHAHREPRWLTEATAWSAALVLVAGIAVASSGVVQHRQTVQQGTRVVQDQDPTLVESTVQKPGEAAVRQVPTVRAGGRATAAGQSIASLGKPPGIVKDLVPTRFAAPEDRWALLIGITHYRKPTHDTLAGANDVEFIYRYLLSAGWLPDHIRVLVNQHATGKNMRLGIDWLASKSKPGTFTYFHYSGHVKQENGHEKLWPYDRDFINDTDFVRVLKRGTGMMWVDVAGCESAGFMEDLPSSRVLVSTSSKVTQKSYEHPDWLESIWVGLVYDAGMNQRQADVNGDGIVTVGEALRFASYWAQVVTFYQRPNGKQSPQVRGMPVRGWTLADPPA